MAETNRGPWVVRGVPMYARTQDCHCFVTVEEGDEVRIRHWKGSSFRAIQRGCRKAYPKAKLLYGRSFWVTR